MNGEAREAPASISKDLIWLILCSLSVVVVLYVLSIGPVMNITDKMNINNPIQQDSSLRSSINPWSVYMPIHCCTSHWACIYISGYPIISTAMAT